jgi:hypothetical protein
MRPDLTGFWRRQVDCSCSISRIIGLVAYGGGVGKGKPFSDSGIGNWEVVDGWSGQTRFSAACPLRVEAVYKRPDTYVEEKL